MNIFIIYIVQYVLTSKCYFVLVLISWWYSDKRISKFHRKEVDTLLSSYWAWSEFDNLEWDEDVLDLCILFGEKKYVPKDWNWKL